ncbi:3-carboxy-cis,cis-mucoante lactonizing enzyme [Ceratobasidium sp. AG-I]|nr:3-carboxy-cis,cis-mucoante lactonizing enzyme [Ceratobasidium sp. AG-I]
MPTTYRILVASYTPNITTLEFDPAAGTLTDIAQSPAETNPSWIAAHPTDKSLILATNEVTDGKVHLFKLQPNGKLKLLESMGTAGEDPAHLAVLEDEVIVGNYSSGTVLAIPFSTTAPHFLSINPPIQLTGTGPNLDRQSSSHPHQIYPTTSNEILVPDLGADRIVRFSKKAQGEWVEVGDIKSNPGTGPRHVQLHDGVLYVVEELTNKLAAHVYPPTSSSSLIKTLPTLPSPAPASSLSAPDFEPNSVTPPNGPEGKTLPLLAAELLLVTKPQPLLFSTNRNETHPKGDSITIYSPLKGAKGKEGFEVIGSVRTGLKHARGAAFGGPDDKYLVVGGADTGGVKVFERSGERGEKLTVVAHMPGVVAPTGFLWV